MLELLAHRDGRAANELAAPFRISQPAASQHLRVLRNSGLVRAVRVGRRQVYRLKPRPLRQVFDWIAFFDKFWDEKLANLGRYLEKQAERESGESPSGKD
jgi:DNA-binding transcriptional ArsR family regulator